MLLQLHDATHLSQRALTAPLAGGGDALALAQLAQQERRVWDALAQWGLVAADTESVA